MKTIRNLLLHLLSCSLLSSVFFPLSLSAAPNVAPTVTINSAAMRPGTTLMDVSYRVTDPDDATVKVRALAFKDGVRSFANVIRPVTWAEGTETNLGDAITTNADHTLTWDVATDWNIQLGQVKMEVLAVDSNGIIPFNGITIPAAGDKPELKINQIGLTDAQTFNGLLWFFASGNSYMEVANGALMGSATSGIFKQRPAVVGATLNQQFAQPFLFKLLDIAAAGSDILAYADAATRTTLPRDKWLTTNRPYAGSQFIHGWGSNTSGQASSPNIFCGVIAIAARNSYNLALKDDGTVISWGSGAPSPILSGLKGVIAISAGYNHCLALRNDGTVAAWGSNGSGQCSVPPGLTGVTAIAAGNNTSLALRSDGSVALWGTNSYNLSTLPAGVARVKAIASGYNYNIVIKEDDNLVAWGYYNSNLGYPFGGSLSGVAAVAATNDLCLALRTDGSLATWGYWSDGQSTIPPGLSGVTSIAVGGNFCLALKSDGTVVAWGKNDVYQSTVPVGLSGVIAVAAGSSHCITLTAKAP